jgi:hypothetical protein
MKKTIVLSLALLCATLFSYSSGMSTEDPVPATGLPYITTLVINANVTVVLVDNDKATLEVAGSNSLTRLVIFNKTADTLVINSARGRDLKSAGVIYVPAARLRNIRINSAAHVKSLYTLQIPKLDVIVNGACEFDIANIGVLNLTGTDNYIVEKNTEVHHLPANVYLNKKY